LPRAPFCDATADSSQRHGRLRTSRLLAEHGPDIKLPDLLREIAQCPKWGRMNDGCEAVYSPSSQIGSALARTPKTLARNNKK